VTDDRASRINLTRGPAHRKGAMGDLREKTPNG
jgi:hypothetical protein